MAMKNRLERLEIRKHNLKEKDAVGNQSLIKKLERRIRKTIKEHETFFKERETSYEAFYNKLP